TTACATGRRRGSSKRSIPQPVTSASAAWSAVADAIGQVLAFAVVVSLSPIPIIAVVLMLGTPRARVNGPAFLLGWVLGLSIVGTIALVVIGSVGATDDAAPATWVSVLKIA